MPCKVGRSQKQIEAFSIFTPFTRRQTPNGIENSGDHFLLCVETGNNVSHISKGKFLSAIEDNQFSSVTQSCPTLCDPVNRSMPGLAVHHKLPEFTQTHARRVGNAIQPSHPAIPFSSCPQSLPASGSFPMTLLFIRWPKY